MKAERLPGEAMPRTCHDLLPGDTFPHYEVRYLDGRTPFDCRKREDVTPALESDPRLHDRAMTVRGVGTKVYLEDLLK